MKIIKADFSGTEIQFQSDGWFNATVAAAKFGKEAREWLKLASTKTYLEAIKRRWGDCSHVKTSKARVERGGGTWLHPRLAVRFAQWLDPDFAVWCDEQIDQLLRGESDWRKQRHLAASTNKLMAQMLQESRTEAGKATKSHHYSNEARMVNWSLTGEFCSLERDQLSAHQLDVLAALESRNALLIGRGVEYAKRKIILEQLAIDMRKPELKLVGAQ